MKSRKSPKTMPDLKAENVRLKIHVSALVAEVRKLQRENIKLKVKDQSAVARIKALEKLKVLPKPEALSDIDIARRIAFLLQKGSLDIHGNPLVKRKS